MGFRLVDPHIANKTRSRKRTHERLGIDARTGRQESAAARADADRRSGRDNLSPGERDAPKFPPAFTGKGANSSAALGSLEGLTGQYGGNTGSASRRAENKLAIAQLIADNKEKNALGDHMRQNPWAYGDRYRTGSTPGLDAAIDFGVAQRTPTSLGQGGPSMTDLESYAFDNPVATGGSTNTNTGSQDNTGGSVLDDIEADLMSGGRQFGDLRTLQNALVQLRGSLNANELQRSRRLEDFALMIDQYRRQADRLRRQIPGGFNRRGMLNSGQFDRGMGEFEAEVVRDELSHRHKLQRALQDLGFSDRAAGHTFDETIRENAISDALASAAKASAISVPGIDGGHTPTGTNAMIGYGDKYMQSLIQGMYGG